MLRAVLVLLLGTCGAMAAEDGPAKDPCGSITSAFADVDHEGGKASFMTADELTRATFILDHIPPESETKWDFAIFVDQNDDSGEVLFGSNGKICQVMGFESPNTWEHVKKAIIGGQWV